MQIQLDDAQLNELKKLLAAMNVARGMSPNGEIELDSTEIEWKPDEVKFTISGSLPEYCSQCPHCNP